MKTLKKDQSELHKKREEMSKMLIESQANKDEINVQNSKIEEQGDQMEKLNLEVTVVVTEKITLKKELDRVDGLYNQLRKEHKEQRVNYNLIVDEVSKANKQNNLYRGLIIDNEAKFSEFEKEVQ